MAMPSAHRAAGSGGTQEWMVAMDDKTAVVVEVIEADIADVAAIGCEAYVNAANNELWMGAGVAGALKRAAGDEVEREAVDQGPIEVGEAVITSSGRIPPPARAIIHAAASEVSSSSAFIPRTLPDRGSHAVRGRPG